MKKSGILMKALFCVLLAAFTLLIPFGSGNIADGEMSIFCAVIASAFGACVMYAEPVIPTISGLLGFAVLLVLRCPVIYALEALSFVPASAAIYFLFKDKIDRQTSVFASSLSVTVFYVGTMLYRIYAVSGSISPAGYRAAYPEMIEVMEKTLSGIGTVAIAGNQVSFINAANVSQFVNLIVSLLPATVYVLVYALFVIVTAIMKRLLEEKNVVVAEENWAYSTGLINFLFLIAAIVLLLIIDSLWAEIAFISFIIILGTQMFFDGLFSAFRIRVIEGRRVFAMFRLSVIALSLFFNPVLVPAETVLFAGYDSVMRKIAEYIEKHGGDDEL
ncbi:MAG: hypothetical protein KBT31_04030 [Firmicutes bacterium]|nr:hypothetical protein [Candidatus Colimorpha enterica]